MKIFFFSFRVSYFLISFYFFWNYTIFQLQMNKYNHAHVTIRTRDHWKLRFLFTFYHLNQVISLNHANFFNNFFFWIIKTFVICKYKHFVQYYCIRNFTKFHNHFMIINHEFWKIEQYFDFTIFFETQEILYTLILSLNLCWFYYWFCVDFIIDFVLILSLTLSLILSLTLSLILSLILSLTLSLILLTSFFRFSRFFLLFQKISIFKKVKKFVMSSIIVTICHWSRIFR